MMNLYRGFHRASAFVGSGFIAAFTTLPLVCKQTPVLPAQRLLPYCGKDCVIPDMSTA